MTSYTEINTDHVVIYHKPGSRRVIINTYDHKGKRITSTWYDSNHDIWRAFDIDSMSEDNMTCIAETMEEWKDTVDFLGEG